MGACAKNSVVQKGSWIAFRLFVHWALSGWDGGLSGIAERGAEREPRRGKRWLDCKQAALGRGWLIPPVTFFFFPPLTPPLPLSPPSPPSSRIKSIQRLEVMLWQLTPFPRKWPTNWGPWTAAFWWSGLHKSRGTWVLRSLKSYSLIWKKSALQFIFSHILKRVCLYKRAMDLGSEGIRRSTGHLHMSSELMCKLLIYTLRWIILDSIGRGAL